MSDTERAPKIMCAYMGPPKQCSECGGRDETATGFCSHDCRAARADREAALEAHGDPLAATMTVGLVRPGEKAVV